jgi:predicted nucleic acid-binding protein
MIVVDTNILVQLWIPSDQSTLSEKVFEQDPIWVAPILWKSEFRSAISLYLRKGIIEISQAIDIMRKVDSQMRDHQFDVDSIQVLELVASSDCSSYDCEFVSLAKDLNIKLITMDKKVLKEFEGTAFHPIDFIV